MMSKSRFAGGVNLRFFCWLSLLVMMLPGITLASELLTFEKLYFANGVLGMKFSDSTLASKGKTVRMRGYMAPPLKPDSRFFVLTRQPVSICPFCSSDAEWPVDIVVIYLKSDYSPTNFSHRIEVEGTLELGSWTDPETGFVSQVRIVDASFKQG